MKNDQPTLGNGKICYLEIPATSINTSASFYHNVFGWHIRERGDGHIAFDDAVGEVSGSFVTNRKPVSEIGILIHIWVDDINASMKKVTEHGGLIVQSVGMDDGELTARFTDPAGNVFGLYQEPIAG